MAGVEIQRPCGQARLGMKGDGGDGCQRSRVRADGSGTHADRVDGARRCGLDGQTIEQRGDRAGTVCRRHVESCVRARRCHRFARGIPAAV
jgi:hypothetical protein